MPLAYYSRAATTEFWSEHWGGHSVDTLVAVARTSPLTALLRRYLPADGRVLEAGCGPGHYVLLLREHGHRVVGADWSCDALREAARRAAPLAAMDLRALAIPDRALDAYVSLGVVEHDPAGPEIIVAEAARTLRPGGVLLLSVPYWNGTRRVLGPWLRRRGRRLSASGAAFYQFAFTRREMRGFLEAPGFTVRAFHPYDPGRIPRKAVDVLRATLSGRTGRPPADRPGDGAAGRGGLRGAARAALYSAPGLRLLGHMLLAVAVRR